MNSTIAEMKEEDDRYKRISERIMNMEKKILDIDEKNNTKTEVTNPGEHMETRKQGKAKNTRIPQWNRKSEPEVI